MSLRRALSKTFERQRPGWGFLAACGKSQAPARARNFLLESRRKTVGDSGIVEGFQRRFERKGPLAARLEFCHRLLTTILLVAAFLGSACHLASPETTPSEITLTLLTTNDLHGGLVSAGADPKSDRPLGGAVALAAAIAHQRQSNPAATLLLDAGDSFQGTPLSNLTQGRVMIDFMNLVGFDATVVGNHGFDWGIPVLLERMEQAEFPFLAANIHLKETAAPPTWAKPYQILERRGVRIAVIGLITTGTPRTTLPENVASLEFLDPAPIANRLIEDLVPAEADLAVLLCHLGLRNPDHEEPSGELRELLERIRGAAAVVGGHTHEVFAGELEGLPVVQAADSGKYLGRIDLVFDRRNRQVLESEAQVFEVFADTPTPTNAVAELVERYRVEFEETMNEVIGTAATDLEWQGDRECRLGNLFADAIRQQTGADFAFQNPFGLRASLDAGEITREDVYQVMPFDNSIVLVRLSGAEIKELLEQAAERIKLLYTSGLRYAVDTTQPASSRITLATPLEADRVYEVSINNFMAQGGDGLTILANRPEARGSGILLRDAFANWIVEETRHGRQIRAEVDGRSRVD